MIPKWLEIATRYLGVQEVVGPGSNPTILRWAKQLGGWIKSFFVDDDIAWCALFVNACLDEAGFKGTNSLAARSFATWGLELAEPALGAVVVFSRKGGGHVGFYLGERKSDGAIRVRGGNQSNQVSDTWLPKSRLLTYRWPVDATLPTTGHVWLSATGGPLSVNEA
jgi:uncharacterized protein (TIGR02594 family)